MARSNPRSSSSSSRKLRFNPRRFLLCGVIVLALLGGVSIVHHFSPRPTQERIESVVLNVIDLARENRSVPRDVVFWLDLLADKIPLARGRVVSPGVPIEVDGMVLGGTPVPANRQFDFLKNKGYIAAYDEQRRNPAWVAYRVFEPKYPSGARPEKFEPDSRTRAKVATSAYSNTGFDRGHMAPNRAIAVCYGAEAQKETFLMSNVTPQLHGLNAAFWESMESRVIERYTKRFGQVWIVCGPVYDAHKTQRKIGDGVTVPDAFFLIVSAHESEGTGEIADKGGVVRTEAFLVPHKEISAREDPTRFLVSVRDIENRTGLNFFPMFPQEAQDALECEAAKRAW